MIKKKKKENMKSSKHDPAFNNVLRLVLQH